MSQSVQNKFNEEIQAELIRHQTEENLKSNPVFREFFNQFNPSSVEGFIRHYSKRKALYMVRGEEFLRVEDSQSFRYKLIAEQGLWSIQQKKLFNLQCQWRAEQIQLKGIEHSTQFMLLSTHIQHCTLISPVTKDEVEMYRNYLCSEQAELVVHYDNWQDYEGFKAEYQSDRIPGVDAEVEEQVPAWYRYYDEKAGSAHFMDLPDIRGEKENRYRSIHRQRQLEKLKEDNPSKKLDDRPYLSIYDTELLESFVKRFEDRQTLRYCKAVERFQKKMDANLEVDAAIEILKTAAKAIPVSAHSDWRQALVQSAQRFELEQVSDLMPLVFEEYQFHLDNGINFTQRYLDRKREEYVSQLCEKARQQILEGRRILNEPENFRF
ncbi:MAG: hypothetical protein RLZZ630_937 [Bacteroidota bacterium]